MIEMCEGLLYGDDRVDSRVADVFLPTSGSVERAVVMIHGGGYRGGTRVDYGGWGRMLAAWGVAALSVDYRLARSGEPSWPGALEDVQAAVEFVSSGAFLAQCGRSGAVRTVVVLGASVGAQLAALSVLGAQRAKTQIVPRAAVCFNGIYDLLAQWEHDRLYRAADDQITELFLGGDPADRREQFYSASPLFHASRQRAHGTRWLLCWGTEDDVVDPGAQSTVFVRHLKRAGAHVRTCVLPGASHYWPTEREVDDDHGPIPTVSYRLKAFLDGLSGSDTRRERFTGDDGTLPMA